MLTEIADICPDCFSFRYQESGCPDCGYRVPEPGKEGPALPVRTMLLNGRYMVGKVIGIGGCGITYKAFDMLYREVCAIKEFMPQGLAGRVPGSRDLQVYRASDQAAYRHGLERFIQEARILKRLKAEPAIVQVKACFTEDKTAYLVMGYLDGQDLRQAAKEGRIGARKAIGIVTEIGKVMGVVHANGILHRDISPENIFLLKDDRVKILDFGSARQQILKGRQEYSVQFKQGFAPPEQYSRTGEQGPYTDVYGLASTCYYILTGCMIPDAMERLQEKAYIPLIRLCPEAGARRCPMQWTGPWSRTTEDGPRPWRRLWQICGEGARSFPPVPLGCARRRPRQPRHSARMVSCQPQALLVGAGRARAVSGVSAGYTRGQL